MPAFLLAIHLMSTSVLSAVCDEGHTYFSQFVVCLVFFLWESSFETLTLQVEMVPQEAATIELLG